MAARNRWYAALVAVATLSCTACTVLFEHPLSDAKTSKPDERLLGEWDLKDDPMDGSVTVTRVAGSKNVLVATPSADQTDPEEKPIQFYTTEIRGQYYACAKADAVDDDEKLPGWVVSRYEMPDPDTVRLYFADAEVFAEAIEAKQLDGRVLTDEETGGGSKSGGTALKTNDAGSSCAVFQLWITIYISPWLNRPNGPGGRSPASPKKNCAEKDYIVTASSEQCVRFLAEHGLECFPKSNELMVFVRHKKDGAASPAEPKVPPAGENAPAATTPESAPQ